MTVECKITNYRNTKEGESLIDVPKIVVRSKWAEGDHAEIEVEGAIFTVSISEMTSALAKCRLDCFGK